MGCAAEQYGHWKSPYITSSSGASAGPATWSSGPSGGVSRAATEGGILECRPWATSSSWSCCWPRRRWACAWPTARASRIRSCSSSSGSGSGSSRGLPALELEPDVVFLVFLPPLLHAAGWTPSPRELRAEVRPLAMLSVGLVLLTMGAVAVVAHAIVPGMGWAAAFVLGAIVGPTDPVSAAATFSRIGVPARVRRLVEGEAMINDGSALVAYNVALTAAVAGTFSPGGALLDFVWSAGAGVAIGLLVGWAGTEIIRRQDDVPLTIFVTLLIAYGALHPRGGGARVGRPRRRRQRPLRRLARAERLRRRDAPRRRRVLARPDLRARGDCCSSSSACRRPCWRRSSRSRRSPRQAVVVALVVVGVRMAWALLPPVGAGDTVRERDRRGLVRACAARSRSPRRSPSDASVTERPEILLITFGVIAVTLLGQGLTLPLVLRALRLPGENRVVAGRGRGAAGDGPGGARPAGGARGRRRAAGAARAAARPLPRALRAVRRGAGRHRRRGPGGPRVRRYGDMRRDADRRRARGRCSTCATENEVPPTCCGAWSATSTSRRRALPAADPPLASASMTEPIDAGRLGRRAGHARPATGACWTPGSRSRASAWTA